jgi:hypothetical protein
MICLNCHATTSNGLALCELCQRWVRVSMEFLPVYFRNLARWKPGKAGARPVPGSREPNNLSTAQNDRIGRALDEAGNALTTWARKLEEDRGIEAPGGSNEAEQVAALCQWLTDHLTSIATLEWCGEFVVELGRRESVLRGLTEQVAPGWYAGACRRCGFGTHVIPGLTWVTCDGCGSTTYARDHLDTVLTEAREWVARPKAVAEVVVAMLDTEMSVVKLYERIKKWEQRGKVEGIRRVDAEGDEIGPKRYRLGDVLDRLTVEGSTRPDASTTEKAAS